MEPVVLASARRAQCTRGQIVCDRREPLAPQGLREAQYYAEEKRFPEEVSVDSDIIGGTSSDAEGRRGSS